MEREELPSRDVLAIPVQEASPEEIEAQATLHLRDAAQDYLSAFCHETEGILEAAGEAAVIQLSPSEPPTLAHILVLYDQFGTSETVVRYRAYEMLGVRGVYNGYGLLAPSKDPMEPPRIEDCPVEQLFSRFGSRVVRKMMVHAIEYQDAVRLRDAIIRVRTQQDEL